MSSELMRAIAPGLSRVPEGALESDLLVRCPAGEFWLCPAPPVEDDGRPWVTLEALRELAARIEREAELVNDWGDD
jgi:hypothetical protein